MKRLNGFFAVVLVLACWGTLTLRAQEANANNSNESLEIEKLKLQIEQLKLENQRLQLKVKTLEIGGATENAGFSATPTPVDHEKEMRRIQKETGDKAAALAKENEGFPEKVVLDLCNGEIWSKGVHYNIPNLHGLFEDRKWDYQTNFLKNDINGDAENRYRYRNLFLDRYEMQSRGVLTLEAPTAATDISFVMPEGITELSVFGDIRNKLETPYYRFDHEEKKDGVRMLCYKHGADFLGYDDVLEVYFDKNDHFLKLRWGMLDKK